MEYANDMPGSAFMQFSSKKKCKESIGGSEGMNLGEIAWNMRVLRANGSLSKFMKEDIRGVTSLMVYVVMMLS